MVTSQSPLSTFRRCVLTVQTPSGESAKRLYLPLSSSHLCLPAIPSKPTRGAVLQEEVTEMADPVKALLEGKVQTVEFSNGNVVVDAPRSSRVYMAGSFNPLHDGHRGMLAAALETRQAEQGWITSSPHVVAFQFQNSQLL